MEVSYHKIVRPFCLLALLTISTSVHAQATGGANMMLIVFAVIAVVVVLGIIIQVANNLLHLEGRQSGVADNNVSLLPKFGSLFPEEVSDAAQQSGATVHNLKKGFDIKLAGAPSSNNIEYGKVTRFALQPKNYIGMAPIPKLLVEEGDSVKAGQPIFFDKTRPEVIYVAPVSGEFIELKRAEKRSIAELIFLADKEQTSVTLNAPDLANASRQELKSFMLANGAWPLMRQRPFNIVPDSNEDPSNIFISTFDTAPLATDLNLAVEGKENEFQKGLDVLAKLTDGKVHVGLDARVGHAPAAGYSNAVGVEKHWFNGPHPAGNVGVQIHHIHPMSTSSKVWTLKVDSVITIGHMFLHNQYNMEKIVSVVGTELNEPKLLRTYEGASISELLSGNLKEGDVRIICGNPLSGRQKSSTQFLDTNQNQLTVIKEGRYNEMFGWLVPTVPKPSISNTFPGAFLTDTVYDADTNTHGERRAFVVTGQYEKVLPMDIYPQALMKAILSNDFERMEGLGIHELVEEDIALCEFVCTSKMPLQKILREGLETMREQG